MLPVRKAGFYWLDGERFDHDATRALGFVCVWRLSILIPNYAFITNFMIQLAITMSLSIEGPQFSRHWSYLQLFED